MQTVAVERRGVGGRDINSTKWLLGVEAEAEVKGMDGPPIPPRLMNRQTDMVEKSRL